MIDKNLVSYSPEVKRPSSEYEDSYDNQNDKKAMPDKNNQHKKNIMIIAGIVSTFILFALVFGIMALTKSCNNTSKDVDIPDFIGMKLSNVQGNASYKFSWKVETSYDPSKDEGIILDQNPKAGSKKVKEGSTITLKVNSSGTLVAVPSVKGMTKDAAKAKIISAGLTCSEIKEVEDSETAVGIVISSDPQEGKEIKINSSVILYVSKGVIEKKITVPNVINKSFDSAKKELEDLGLKVEKSTKDSEKEKDTVISQDPLNSVSVDKGTTVKLVVSTGISSESKAEKTLKISAPLPPDINYAITLKTYVDWNLVDTISIIPSEKNNYSYSVKGASGTKTVAITLNGENYRIYSVNFDTGSITVQEEKEFISSNSSESSSSSSASDSSSSSSSSSS